MIHEQRNESSEVGVRTSRREPHGVDGLKGLGQSKMNALLGGILGAILGGNLQAMLVAWAASFW